MILLLYDVPSIVVGLSVFQRVKAGPFPYLGPRAHTNAQTHKHTHAAPAPPSRSMHARTVTATDDVVVAAAAAALHHVSRPRLLRPCSHKRHRIIIYIFSYIRVSRSRGRSAPHIVLSPCARAALVRVCVCVCVCVCVWISVRVRENLFLY